jgi:carboxyl-terminal processing protease
MKNRTALSSYKTSKDFTNQFVFSNEGWQLFETMALKDSVNISSATLSEKNELSFKLKAMLARQLWRNEGLYEVLNINDDMIKKALETIKANP